MAQECDKCRNYNCNIFKRYKNCIAWWSEKRVCECGVPCVDDPIDDPCEYFKCKIFKGNE